MIGAEGYRAPRDPLIGQVVQERYRIVHAIGRGAMGVVYEAQHLLIGRKVALKAMAAHAASPAGVRRFRREAQAAAAVGNSHVVDVLDMGQLDNGAFYIVMEHLDGIDLGFAVALQQRFSVARAIHVLAQLCDAFSAIHAAGIIHRDLKPENIFLTTRDGTPDFVKVLDFGVCKFNQTEGARLTATGDTIGTPLFMAPEQVEGRSDCDHRADIYALGAILYFVLTGRAPFDAPNLPALFLRICREPAPSLVSSDNRLSFELDAIVQRALSKEPSARFSSCSAFKAALRSLQASTEECAATLPGTAPDSLFGDDGWPNGPDSLVRTQRFRQPRWFAVGAIGVAAFALAVSAGAYLVQALGAAPSSVQARVRLSPSKAEISPPVESLPVESPPVERTITVADSVITAAAPKLAKTPKDQAPGLGPRDQPSAHPEPLPTASASATAEGPQSSPSSRPAPAASVSSPAADVVFTRSPKRDL